MVPRGVFVCIKCIKCTLPGIHIDAEQEGDEGGGVRPAVPERNRGKQKCASESKEGVRRDQGERHRERERRGEEACGRNKERSEEKRKRRWIG